MKKIITITGLLWMLVGSHSMAQWNQTFLNNVTNDAVNAMDFSSDGKAILVRRDDYVVSNDFGQTWTINPVASISCAGTGWRLNTVSVLSQDTFLITGYNSSMSSYLSSAVTFDGGTSFICNTFTNSTVNRGVPNSYLSFSGRSFIGGEDGQLFRSDDFGINYSMVSNVSGVVRRLSFANDTLGYFMKDANYYKYDSISNNLTPVTVPFPSSLGIIKGSQVVDSLCRYVLYQNTAGTESNIYKSSNGGQTWNLLFQVNFSGNNMLNNIYFLNKDTGYVVGNGILLRTLDGGDNWEVQRFPGCNFTEVRFIDFNNGVLAGVNGSSTIAFRTTNGGGVYKPFSYFYNLNAACCENINCNTLLNTGSFLYSYTWLLDNVPVSTGYSPSNLNASGGTHMVSLITSNGVLSDTFSLNVYFAPPLPVGTQIPTSADTTICYNTSFCVSINPTVNGYYYSLWNGSTSISSELTGNGGMANICTPSLTDTTLITVLMKSNYYYCPGNSVTKDFNIFVYPNSAETMPYFSEDSVCFYDTTYFVIPNSISGANYGIFSGPCPDIIGFNANVSGTGSDIVYPVPISVAQCSNNYYYIISDNFGCTNQSENTFLLVDSVHARLYGTEIMGYIGDTLRFSNRSEGAFSHWGYDSNFLTAIDTGQAPYGYFRIDSTGNFPLFIKASNYTGCKDSIFQIIHAFDSISVFNGDYCIGFETEQDMVDHPFADYTFHNYQRKLHVDKEENQYLSGVLSLPAGNDGIRSIITKYDKNGNLVWSHTLFGNTSIYTNKVSINSFDTDSLLNCYVSGRYYGEEFTIGGLTPPDYNNKSFAFLAKLNSSGLAEWILTFRGDCYWSGTSTFIDHVKVLDNETIVAYALNVDCIHKIPGNNIIWDNGPMELNGGFFFIGQDGTVKNAVNYNLQENELVDLYNFGDSHKIGEGMRFEMIGSKIIILSTHRILQPFYQFAGSTFLFPQYDYENYYGKTGIVTVLDTSGTIDNNFVVFSYLRKDSLFDKSDWYYYDVYTDYEKSYSGDADLSVRANGYIYISYTPDPNYIAGNNFVDSITKRNYVFDIPGSGVVPCSQQGSLIQKTDTAGNIYFSLINHGLYLKNTELGKNGDLYGIADYARFYSFSSADGTTQGAINQKGSSNSVVFAYDANGILKWAEPVISNGYMVSGYTGVRDTCNSSLYFAFVAEDTAQFMGNIFPVHHKYHHVTINTEGNCSDSVVCPWPVPVVASIKENSEIHDWQLYPNPSTDMIYVTNQDKQSGANICIYDQVGKKVIALPHNNLSGKTEIDIKNLASGIYIVGIETGSISVQNFCFIKL